MEDGKTLLMRVDQRTSTRYLTARGSSALETCAGGPTSIETSAGVSNYLDTQERVLSKFPTQYLAESEAELREIA